MVSVYLATLQDTFYIFGIIFMSVILLLVFGLIIAGFVVRSKVRRKIDETAAIPRKILAFFGGFRRGW